MYVCSDKTLIRPQMFTLFDFHVNRKETIISLAEENILNDMSCEKRSAHKECGKSTDDRAFASPCFMF